MNFVCSKNSLFFCSLAISASFSFFPFLFNVYLPISTQHNYNKSQKFLLIVFSFKHRESLFECSFCLLFDSFFLWAPQKFYFKMADVKLLLNADYYSERYFFSYMNFIVMCTDLNSRFRQINF